MARAAVSGCVVVLVACSFDTSGVGAAEASGGVLDGSSSSSSGDGTTGATTASTTTTETTGDEPTADGSTSMPPTSATTDDGDPGDPCAACAPEATCVVDDGEAICTCPVDHEGNGQQCAPIPALEALRVELACGLLDVAGTCGTAADDVADATMIGAPATVYDVGLRIRGVFELKRYTGGGVPDGLWLAGGGLGFDGDSAVTLTISAPPQSYRLNANADAGAPPQLVDYTRTVQVAQGATLTLQLASLDFFQIQNPGLDVPDVPPEGPYDGQFVQIDVESIVIP